MIDASPWTVVSPRRWQEFQECPRRYFDRYVLRLPAADDNETSHSHGLAVHEELHARHAEPGRHDAPDLVVDDLAPSSRVLTAVAQHRAICPAPDATYIDGERELFWLLKRDRVLLNGRVDALWRYPDGTLEVRDYKTGRRAGEQHERFAIQVYALLAASMTPRAPRIRIVLEHLGGDAPELTVVDADRTFLNAAVESVLAAAATLQREVEFAAVPSPATCEYCAYRALCPGALTA